MRNKLIVLAVILGFIIPEMHSQKLFHEQYTWNKQIVFPENTSEEKIILNKREIVEFSFEENYFFEYQLKHEVEFINSEEEVEKANRKYIPYNVNAEVVKAKARVINPDKDTIELDESKILTSVNEETGENYKYFALEGLKKGSIVEYYYVIKKLPGYNGASKYIQNSHLIINYQFDLFVPANLKFSFMVLNDTTRVQADTALKEKKHWVLAMDSIPALKDEESSPYNLLLKQIIYKLDENITGGKKDISSFGTASQNVYANIYTKLDKADHKALKKLIKMINLPDDASTEDKIRKIENYIKLNINITEANNRYNSISQIVSNKIASAYGITTLFANLFKQYDIKHEIVLTCDRFKATFDKEFESFHFLSEYLFYFPETEAFIKPDQFEYRYGLIPFELTDNNGLFIKEVSLGEFKTGIGKVKYIPPAGYKKSHHNHHIKALINNDFSLVNLDLMQSSSGYYAVFMQPYIELFSEDVLKNFTEEVLKGFIKQIDIESWEYENENAELVGKEPLILNGKVSSSELIDLAGNKYLFKVGDLIGPQVELYSEEERKLPVYDEYKREFVRKLIIEIPEGYHVKNLDDLIIYADYEKEGKKILLFDSKYKVEGQTIIIDINEYYDQLYYELEEYPYYRKVVNSASDFNKVILIIEKN